MQIPIAVLVPYSEYKNFLEELFQVSLTSKEAGNLIYDIKYEIQNGIILKDAARTLKESEAPPQTIVFVIDITKDIAKDISITIASGLAAKYLHSKFSNVSWLKIGSKNSKNNLDDIRKIIQEELEKIEKS